MSIVSRSEFAAMCGGVKDATLRQHINRKKIICNAGDSGKIDTEHPINAQYIKERRAEAGERKEMAAVLARIPPNKSAGSGRNKKGGVRDDEELEDDDDDPPAIDPEVLENMPDEGDSNSWYKRKLIAETRWVERKAEREKLLLEKAEGKLIHVDMVTNMIEIYAKDLKVGYEEGIENLANIFCQIMAAGDVTKYNEVMDRCRELLEKCWQEAGDKINADIDQAVDDFTGKKL